MSLSNPRVYGGGGWNIRKWSVVALIASADRGDSFVDLWHKVIVLHGSDSQSGQLSSRPLDSSGEKRLVAYEFSTYVALA